MAFPKEKLLPCPSCGGRAAYCDDGPEDQRIDCCGNGDSDSDGCGLTVWGHNNFAVARVVWNNLPRHKPKE
jgi:hypothetical protein